MIVEDFNDGAKEAIDALYDFAENDASTPERVMVARMLLLALSDPMLSILTTMGLLSLLGDRIKNSQQHLDALTGGFRGALKADVARHEGASA